MAFSLAQRAASAFCFALIIHFCFSSPTAKSVTLRPVHSPKYDRSFALQPRDPNEYSQLDPQTQGELVYGSPPDIRTIIP